MDDPAVAPTKLKRALHFAGDLVLGTIYGYILGMAVYFVVFAVLLQPLSTRKTAQGTGFTAGMWVMLLEIVLKVWRGQRSLGGSKSN
jgi:hypothetical protein